MINSMKKILGNSNVDIFEVKATKEDITDITLIENVKIKHKASNTEYFNSSFLKITNRKGETRVLDLISHIDITNIFDSLELIYSKKTKEKPIFCEY